jgi:hypothetical protein
VRRPFSGLILVLAAVALLTVPSALPSTDVEKGPPPASLSTDSEISFAPVNSTLTVSPTAIDLSPTFWGTTVTPRARLLPNEGALVNATPTEIIVWPGGSTGDQYNPLTNRLYSATNGSSSTPPVSEAEFAAWCHSINCSTILQVPGEIDDPLLAAQIVNYTENTLGLHPRYWEIGNEPERWKNWQVPWNQWPALGPTVYPMSYAWEVANYTKAMRAVDPSIHIIGIPATARDNGPWTLTDWLNATVTVNAANLSGVAFHDYPAGVFRRATLPGFYGVLNGPPGLPARVGEARAAIAATLARVCPTCAPIPVLVTEVGSALSHWQFAGYSVGFAGAVDLAAQMTQAIDLNLTNADLFASVFDTSNSWFNSSGSQRPDYVTYSEFLNHLGSQGYQVNLTGFNRTMFAIDTLAPQDGGRRDLLVVNTNVTSSVTFVPQFAGPSVSTPTEIWQWDGLTHYGATNRSYWVTPQTPGPIGRYNATGLPLEYTLPPQSIVLFESYPGPGVPVTFAETGLAGGNHWYVQEGGRTYTTSGPNLTLFLAPGTHPVASSPLSLPLNVTTRGAKERLDPFLPSPIAVASTPETVPVDFAAQWHLNLTTEPTLGGSIAPQLSWWNASQPLTLSATPAAGYAFGQWFGWGRGSVNGTAPSVTLVPATAIDEKAIFHIAYDANFTESGLPSSTRWSVVVRGTTYATRNSSIEVPLANGTYGFSLPKVAGYRSHPSAGSVNVTGRPVDVPVQFDRLTPPPPSYSVTFEEAGLATGTPWSVTVRNVTHNSTTSTIGLAEPNGTYGYEVGRLVGYRALPENSSFRVVGASLVVTVTFVARHPPPPLYLVTFRESGLPTGTPWAVTVRNVTVSATAATLSFDESNGSYGFQVTKIVAYRAVPPRSGFNVTGGPTDLAVSFVALRTSFPAVWRVTGIWTTVIWWCLLNGTEHQATGDWLSVSLRNGTYEFALGDSADFVPQPRYGTFVVSGTSVVFAINFTRAEFPVHFSAHGLPPNTGWKVRVSNVTSEVAAPLATFNVPNGTYTFDVSAPSGYYPTPSHGNLTVVAGAPPIVISFVPNGPPPIPPLLELGGRAALVAAAIGLAGWGGFVLAGRWHRTRPRAGAKS